VAYAHGGVVPSVDFERAEKPYPMLRYPWVEARAALMSLAQTRPDLQSVQITYTNPETGGDAQNILGYYAQMLRPGQTLKLPVRSPAMVFHLIEGAAEVLIESQRFALSEADTCCAPGYTAVTLANRSASAPAFFFIADETPLHKKLGVFERRG
jgi:gentisate 1,2-dioxygenase